MRSLKLRLLVILAGLSGAAAAPALLALTLSLEGCRFPPPNPNPTTFAECATEEARAMWPSILPRVNQVLLTGGADWEMSLLSLVGQYGYGLVRCALGDQAPKMAEQARDNPADTVSAQGAARAREFAAKYDAQFGFRGN